MERFDYQLVHDGWEKQPIGSFNYPLNKGEVVRYACRSYLVKEIVRNMGDDLPRNIFGVTYVRDEMRNLVPPGTESPKVIFEQGPPIAYLEDMKRSPSTSRKT